MTASESIDKRIKELPDWQGLLFMKLRKLIHDADSEIIEEWKWDTAVFSHNGMACALGAFKDHAKINFFKGALLKDTHKLLNAGFESKQHRSIDFREGYAINELKLKDLIKEAVALNTKKK